MKNKHIIVVGGGFGGIYTARKLSKQLKGLSARITVISETNYFLFTPLLHEVATGGLSALSVAEPVREIFRGSGINFIQGKVTSIETRGKYVVIGDDKIYFDYLVVAPGATTDFHSVTGAKENAYTLKSLEDAVKIRNRIIDQFESAAILTDKEQRQRKLSFVVVGGGATGVELAAELAEFIYATMCGYYAGTFCTKADAKVVLVSSGELLKDFSSQLRSWSRKILKNKGVIVYENKSVEQVAKNNVILTDKMQLDAETTIWTAGVTPQTDIFNKNIGRHLSGRVWVNDFMQLVDHPEIFVLGDAVAVEQDGQLVPMLAQSAVGQAAVVSRNIYNLINNQPLTPFKYKPKGFLVSLGQWQAVGQIWRINIRGRFTWWLWRTVYLFKFFSVKKRFKVALEWTINLMYPRDVTKV